MAFLKNLLSTSRAHKASKAGSSGRDSRADGLDGTHGHETLPVKMNLDERMAFRRELLYETIRVSLNSRFIAANTYRFKVMRTDKRGHCFVVMLDMSPTFMASPAGHCALLKETAAMLIKNAETKYGLMISGVYWREDETLEVSVANWARPVASVPPIPCTESQRQSNIENLEAVTAEEMAEFEDAWQKGNAIQVGNRTYSSDLAPLGNDQPRK